MEIDSNNLDSSTKSPAILTATKCEGEQSQQSQTSQDETQSDSDSGAMACPLFMEGLPRDFATNPQLAAIASLLDDEVREETTPSQEDENDNVTATVNNKKNRNSKNLPSSQKYSTQLQQSKSSKSYTTHSGKARNRRRKQRATPYPKLQDRKNEKQAGNKSASVGEITLFMNMWKP